MKVAIALQAHDDVSPMCDLTTDYTCMFDLQVRCSHVTRDPATEQPDTEGCDVTSPHHNTCSLFVWHVYR